MKLNQKQRWVMLIGVSVIVLMGICPPWVYTEKHRYTYNEKPAPYGFVVSPPSNKKKFSTSGAYGIKIDITRLLIQWAVIVAASGFGVLVTATQKDAENS